MKIARQVLAFAVALFALIAQPALAASKWLRADTHNFIIYSSGSRDQLQKFAENVERFDALLRVRTKVPREEEPNRLTIYLLAESGDVASMVSDKRNMVAGIYLPRREGTFAIANRETADSKQDLSGNTVLFHEYAHHFMFRYFNAPYPAWYIEGFAEFVSTATFKTDGSWTLGTPAYHRAFGLLETRKPAIESLLAGEAIRRNPEQTDAFYGRAWLLVHMLTMDKARAGQLTQYLRSIVDGMPQREAAGAAFGDLAQLDKDLDRYLKRRTVSALGSIQQVVADGPIAITELDPFTSQMTVQELRRRTGKEPLKTRDNLAALAARSPASAEAWYQLGMAELLLGEPEKDSEMDELSGTSVTLPNETARKAASTKAMAAVDRALAANPDHARANILKARLLMEDLRDKGDFEAASWRTVRNHIVKANAAAKLDPLPLATWFESFVSQGKTPTKVASDGLAMAYNLAPEVDEFRVNYAFDLARLGQFDQAIKLVEVLAYSPHQGEMGQAVLAQIKAMREAAKDKAEAEETGPAG